MRLLLLEASVQKLFFAPFLDFTSLRMYITCHNLYIVQSLGVDNRDRARPPTAGQGATRLTLCCHENSAVGKLTTIWRQANQTIACTRV